MNTIHRSLLSVLLVIALLLPMAPAAKAAVVPSTPATSVTLSPATGNDVYYRLDRAGTITISAAARPISYDGTITWSLDNRTLLTANRRLGTALTYAGNESITLTAAAVGNTNLRVSLQDASGNETIVNSVEIRVLEDAVDFCVLTPATSSIEIGKSTVLTATAAYLSGSGTPAITYSSSAPAVATVNASGVVTGISRGTAIITATPAGDPLHAASATVTVSAPTSSLTGNATMGTNYSMQDIYDGILLQFSQLFSKAPSIITFSDLNRAYGTLKAGAGANIVAGDPYSFAELRSMYLVPAAAGAYTCGYTVADGINSLSGVITITITTPTTHIRVPISGSGDYRFDRASMESSGKTGAELIRAAVGTFGSIQFGAVQTGSDIGTLYTSTAANYNDRVASGTIVSAGAVDALYFIPNRSGTYSIAYAAFSNSDGTGTLIASGNLLIPVDAASLNVSVNLDSTAPYTFSAAPRTGANSASSLLINTIDSAVGTRAWGGIKFDAAAPTVATIGTLHQNSGYTRAVSSDDYITTAEIANLYFVPERVGTYEINYGVYSGKTSVTPLATGTLTINISNVPTGNADFTYTTTVNGSVKLKESDFIDFFQNKYGSRYYLSSVTFDDYSGSNTFYHDESRFVPYNSADLYTSTYTGSLPQSAHYLDRLSFTAPKTAGFTVVQFTCSGGTSANAVNIHASGRFYIFYTDANVPVITYNVYNSASVSFREEDFLSVYKTATKDTTVKPSFEIKLLSVPADGVLNRYYSSTGSTPMTANRISNYTFTINGLDADSVSRLSYVPGRSAAGSESISYIAYGSNGALLYTGEIRFKLSADRTASAYSDGLSFQANDFYSSADSDPVVYVTFSRPSSGRMYAYTDSRRYVEAPAGTKFYIPNVPGVTASGDYPITSALYAPKANETGTVTLTCVAHRRSGATYEDVINVSLLSKSASSTFTDVNGSIGWAANSIDFSKRLGLVGGTSSNPPLFSPRDTMRRCDLVLILYRLAGSPVTSGVTPYVDLPAATSSTYAAEINNSALWAYRNGVMQNVVTDSFYAPNTALTRQDFAQILCNYTKAMGGNTANAASLAAYSDASQVSSYALEGVQWAVANGYITSTSTTALNIEPQRAATRAEIVTLLHRYLTY